MSRTAIVVIAGLIVAGCVVAMLPAQESSRRRASAYQPQVEQTPIVDPGAFVPAGSAADGDALQSELRATEQQIANEFAPPPGNAPGAAPAFAPAPDDPAPFQPPEDPAALPDLPSDDAQAAAPPMTTLAQPAAASASDAEAPLAEASPATESPVATIPESTELAPVVQRPAAGEMRSVLKRPQTTLVSEAAAPTTSAPPITKPQVSGSTSSRRPSVAAPATISATNSSRQPTAIPAAAGRSIQDLAISGRTAALRVDVAGPQGITVKKPATYVVSVVNENDVPAEDVQVRVALPAWVVVNGSAPSDGEAMMQADAQGTARLLWSIPKLGGRSHEQLKLQLVTREGDAFELGVDWTCRPAAARASIVVKQPQLDLSLAGPGDMIFGEEKVFTLSVSNPGTGDAEQVVVQLTTGDGRTQPIEVGNVAAGQKKEIPLQVVANQAGEMELKATASGEGGLTAEAAGRILVRKAELNLAVEGPPLKYAGTEATYLVTVTNSGNALADNVNLSLALPTAARYLGGLDGAQTTASGDIKWKVSSLPPGSERQFEVRVQLQAAGLNRLIVQANAASAGAAASHQAETEVEAVSDLKLVINDPAGPLPTTEQAVYEVQVTNRGSQSAEQVKIVVQFSEGIEPVAFDGCEARIVPGQVLCKPLTALGAGEQVTLRIKAKSLSAGTHQFRVEVTAADADTRLVSEGTTRFFSESSRVGPAASTAKKPALVPAPGGARMG